MTANDKAYDYVSSQDEKELRRESDRGIPAGIVTENGIMTMDDVRYLLVAGDRDCKAALSGLALWDPATRDTVLALPDKGKILVRQGSVLMVTEMLVRRGKNRRLFAAAAESLANAYDEDRELVSRWLIDMGIQGLREVLSYYGEDAIEPEWVQSFPRDVKVVWRALKDRGVNPWPGRAC